MMAQRIAVAEKVEIQARYNSEALAKVSDRARQEGQDEAIVVGAEAKAQAAMIEWSGQQKILA